MLRSFFIYLSKAAWARKIVTRWQFAWRAASRFVAGETIDDAIRAIQTLNEKGINATLDHLGENTTSPEAARRATQDILDAFEAIEASGVCANVSVKLSQIGMALDEALCYENLATIIRSAQDKDSFVRLDMEDATWTDTTLRLFFRALDQFGADRVGIVLQAYLYRTEKDLEEVLSAGGRVRLCKGAYKEPPQVAFPKKADVDANYDHLAMMLINKAQANGGQMGSMNCKIPPIPAIASHDEQRIAFAKEEQAKAGIPKNAIEFQMLYGIRRELQEKLANDGYPVRVYVPYGTEWYPYYTRRLAERPANVWFFISNYFRK